MNTRSMSKNVISLKFMAINLENDEECTSCSSSGTFSRGTRPSDGIALVKYSNADLNKPPSIAVWRCYDLSLWCVVATFP